MSPKKTECTTFEPQAWRKTLCKNCFRTREQHGAPSSRPQTPVTDSESEAGSRPPTPAIGISEPPNFPQVGTKIGLEDTIGSDSEGQISTDLESNKSEAMGDKLKKMGKGWLRPGISEDSSRSVIKIGEDSEKKARIRADGIRSPTPMPPRDSTTEIAPPSPLGGATGASAAYSPSITASNQGCNSHNVQQSGDDKNRPPLPTSVQTATPALAASQVGSVGADIKSSISSTAVRDAGGALGGSSEGKGKGSATNRTRMGVRERGPATADVDSKKADTGSSAAAVPTSLTPASTVVPLQPKPALASEQKQARLSIQLSPPSSANTSPLSSPNSQATTQQPTAIHSKVNSQIVSGGVEHRALQQQTPSNLKQQPPGKSGLVLLANQGGGEQHTSHSRETLNQGLQVTTHEPPYKGESRVLVGPLSPGHSSGQPLEKGHSRESPRLEPGEARRDTSDLFTASPPCPPTSPAAVSPQATTTATTKATPSGEPPDTQHHHHQPQTPLASLSILPTNPTQHSYIYSNPQLTQAHTDSNPVLVPSLDIQTSRYREFANNAHNVSPGTYTSGHNLLQVKAQPSEGQEDSHNSTEQYHNQYNNQYGNTAVPQGQSTSSASKPQYHPPQAAQTYTASNSLFQHTPEDPHQSWGAHNSYNSPSRISGGGLVLQFEDDKTNIQANKLELAKSSRRRRRLMSYDETDIQGHRRKMADLTMGLSRDEALMEGTRMIMDNLRDKLHIAEQRCEQVEREKAALTDLLGAKKMEISNLEDDSQCHIGELEDQVRRLTLEKSRLMEKLKLPESERASLVDTENEIAILIKKLDDMEMKFEKSMEENEHLHHEIQDLHLEMDEMHDQFREDEAMEFREMQKDLEATAKNCRILQFKLRKSERRNEQLEHDQMQYEDKIRQLESRFETADDKQHIRELEEELRMAKEVSVRLHDELELVEERRARYEEELDRVNDILTESENRRQALQKELDQVVDQMAEMRSEQRAGGVMEKRLDVLPVRAPKLGSLSREGSKELDVEQLMRDLSDSLERENDVKEQLKFAEEEARTMRKKLSDMEEENESLTMQLQKLSSAKSGKFFGKKKKVPTATLR